MFNKTGRIAGFLLVTLCLSVPAFAGSPYEKEYQITSSMDVPGMFQETRRESVIQCNSGKEFVIWGEEMKDGFLYHIDDQEFTCSERKDSILLINTACRGEIPSCDTE